MIWGRLHINKMTSHCVLIRWLAVGESRQMPQTTFKSDVMTNHRLSVTQLNKSTRRAKCRFRIALKIYKNKSDTTKTKVYLSDENARCSAVWGRTDGLTRKWIVAASCCRWFLVSHAEYHLNNNHKNHTISHLPPLYILKRDIHREPSAALPANVSFSHGEWQPSCSSAAFEETRSCEWTADLDLTQFHSRYSCPPAAITLRPGNKDEALSFKRNLIFLTVTYDWLTVSLSLGENRGWRELCCVSRAPVVEPRRCLESVSAQVRMRQYGFLWGIFLSCVLPRRRV